MGKSIVPMGFFFGLEAKWSSAPPPPPIVAMSLQPAIPQRGCTPALPASASVAGFILEHRAATVNTSCTEVGIWQGGTLGH